MTPEKQRIKIAEFDGWKNIHVQDCCGRSIVGWKSPGPFEEIPDYPNDLNAMHDVESRLPCGCWTRYCQYLAEFGHGSVRFVVAHATAQHRAEAFLKTLGLWETNQPPPPAEKGEINHG